MNAVYNVEIHFSVLGFQTMFQHVYFNNLLVNLSYKFYAYESMKLTTNNMRGRNNYAYICVVLRPTNT